MKSLKITDDWDIFINNNGDFVFIDGNEELLQTACHAVYTFSGEDPFNENNGIPYFEKILSNKVSSKNLLEAYMRYEIRDIENIVNIYLMAEDFNQIKRNFSTTVAITTTLGE